MLLALSSSVDESGATMGKGVLERMVGAQGWVVAKVVGVVGWG